MARGCPARGNMYDGLLVAQHRREPCGIVRTLESRPELLVLESCSYDANDDTVNPGGPCKLAEPNSILQK